MRTLRTQPHPSAAVVDSSDRLTREWELWLSEFVKSSQFNTLRTGVATLTATTSVVVSLAPSEADASYSIHYDFGDDRRMWTTAKGSASFQANSNISTTIVAGWTLVRRGT